ncbi:uncharacterized protein [Penaeus vannamei]|uniref:uncharacterized protein n=1 Tax=Penaeus vannamei TaxID=6689 RepID=UPI00387F51E8
MPFCKMDKVGDILYTRTLYPALSLSLPGPPATPSPSQTHTIPSQQTPLSHTIPNISNTWTTPSFLLLIQTPTGTRRSPPHPHTPTRNPYHTLDLPPPPCPNPLTRVTKPPPPLPPTQSPHPPYLNTPAPPPTHPHHSTPPHKTTPDAPRPPSTYPHPTLASTPRPQLHHRKWNSGTKPGFQTVGSIYTRVIQPSNRDFMNTN